MLVPVLNAPRCHCSLTHRYIGAVNSDGITPLGLVARLGKLDTIKYLITECNVDINGKLEQQYNIHVNEVYSIRS